MTPAELQRRAGLCAFLGVIVHFYPRVAGDRDYVCLALTGTLVRAGLEVSEVDQFVVGVAKLAGDEEADRRGGKAVAASEALASGRQAWGLPELCRRLSIEEIEPSLRTWLEGAGSNTSASTVAEIIVIPGHVLPMLDQVESALVEGGAGLYQQSGRLVRIIRYGSETIVDGVTRRTGALALTPVTVPWLREQMGRTANFVKLQKEARVAVDPPPELAKTYVERVGEWRVPELKGLAQCPTLRSDGTVLQTEGYDEQSGLFYDPGTTVFTEVPDHPGKTEALAALELLKAPFREFPFADGDLSLSVALAAVLTALVRGSLATAPLFAIDAPTPGSGKSMIAEMVGAIAAGRKPSLMSQGKNKEEDEKRLASSLMAGDAIIVIDNCEAQVEGDFLCTMLTQESIAARVLGRSERVSLSTKTLMMATGNNLSLAGDVIRRAVVCRLDAGTERPEQIDHSFNPVDEVLRDRPRLVVAGLTILRAFIVAGRPVRPMPAMGSFETWDLIRGAIIWLGLPDPLQSQNRLAEADPRRAELGELLEILRQSRGRTEFKAADLDEAGVGERIVALLGLHHFSARAVGKRFAGYVDRPVDGLVLRSRMRSSTRTFWVEKAEGEDASHPF